MDTDIRVELRERVNKIGVLGWLSCASSMLTLTQECTSIALSMHIKYYLYLSIHDAIFVSHSLDWFLSTSKVNQPKVVNKVTKVSEYLPSFWCHSNMHVKRPVGPGGVTR